MIILEAGSHGPNNSGPSNSGPSNSGPSSLGLNKSGPVKRPVVWSITASDSAAGAGMQADVAVCNQWGVQVQCVVTAITAQNSAGFQQGFALPLSQVQAQWQALKEDGWPEAIRVGWLPNDDGLWRWLADAIEQAPCPVIWDPVISATDVSSDSEPEGGASEMRSATVERYRALLACVDVITPNKAEARLLLGLPDSLEGDVADPSDNRSSSQQMARALSDMGPSTVIITGGDTALNEHPYEIITDVFHRAVTEEQGAIPEEQGSIPEEQAPEQIGMPAFQLLSERIMHQAHGTGCHFAAALAAGLASGSRLYDAILKASEYALQCLEAASERSSGYHNCFAAAQQSAADHRVSVSVSASAPDLASVSQEAAAGASDGHAAVDFLYPLDDEVDLSAMTLAFPVLDKPLGLYGLVDNQEWLKRLLTLGVDTLQWRVKHQSVNYREETAEAIALCREAGVPLYINDDWPLALELEAWGVHLGQEDLCMADLTALAQAGLCLGVSTHTEWEIARARTIKPSYIAFGPVFPPLSKKLKYPPLGLEQLSRWCEENSDFPLTCIGGITEDNVADVVATGMPSVAIVTALTNDEGLAKRFERIRQAI